MNEIKSHAEAAGIFRESYGPNAQVSMERLFFIVGNDWAEKMRGAGVVVKCGSNLFQLSELYK